MKQKGLAPILIVILVAAVIGLGGFLIYTQQTEFTPPPNKSMAISQTPHPIPLAKTKSTLNVKVQPELIAKVQVYSGPWSGTGNVYGTFPDAHLVAEKAMDPSGTVSFILEQGDYFVDVLFNAKWEKERYGSIPQNVHLDRDLEISVPTGPPI